MEREDDLDDEDYQTREVYAQFGLAVYLAQVLEKGVLNTLVVAESVASGERDSAAFEAVFDATWARSERLSLGLLLKRFAAATHADVVLLDDLREALETRNRLAHFWFWDHAEDAFSTPGREAMLAELLLIQQDMQTLDGRVHQVLVRQMARVGWTEEALDEAISQHYVATRTRARLRDEE